MRTTIHAVFLVLVAAATIGFPATPVLAQTDITRDEYICGSNVAKTMARFIVKKSACVQRCVANGRKTFGPFGDCFAPFGGTTAACILDPTRGAEEKARTAIGRRCAADCPECFSASVCTNGEPFVTNVSIQLDLLSSFFVYCVESNGDTVSPAETACEDAVARAVSKHAASRIRCYTRCFAKILGRSCPTCKSGQLPEGSCDPLPSDPSSAACIARAEAKAVAAIDAACSNLGANPACYAGNGLDTGAAWISFMGGALDGQVPNVACGG
jgi:hypothetical protein